MTTITNDMKEALSEADTYNRMGGLDDQLFEDIAHEHSVESAELKRRWYEDDRE